MDSDKTVCVLLSKVCIQAEAKAVQNQCDENHTACSSIIVTYPLLS